MEIKDLGEFISTSISSLDKYKEILLQAAQVLGKSQAKLDDEYSKRAPLASTEEKVQAEVAVEEVKQEEQVVEETPVAQEEVKEEKVEEVEKEAPKPAPQAEPQVEQPKYVVTDFGRGPKGPRPQNGQKPPFNQNGPRPPFDPHRKPGFNKNGNHGFKQQHYNFIA